MHSYFAIQKDKHYAGGWQSVVCWARESLKYDSNEVKLLMARAAEKEAQVVAVLSRDEEKIIRNGRRVKLRVLYRGKS